MHVTLKTMEKLDKLLTEADELVTCASTCDDQELKSIYMDLARCHYDGYEKLSKATERAVDRKANQYPGEKGQTIKEMATWHKDKYDERAAKIKMRMDAMR